MNISKQLDISLDNLYCKKCKKNFKNIGTLNAHLASKSHLKNKNSFTKKKIQFINTNTDTLNITYSEPCKIIDFQEKLFKVLKRESNKKYTRKDRMFKNTNSVNSALNELTQNYFENGKNNFYQKSSEKINRAADNLQKNILTSSRSSFVKSTLKP